MAKNHKKLNVHRKKTLTWLKNHKKTYLPRKKAFEGGGVISQKKFVSKWEFTHLIHFRQATYAIQIYAMVQAKNTNVYKNTRND